MAVPAERLKKIRDQIAGEGRLPDLKVIRGGRLPPRTPEIGYVPLERVETVSAPSTYIEHVNKFSDSVKHLSRAEVIPHFRALKEHLLAVKWGGVNPGMAETAHERLFTLMRQKAAESKNAVFEQAVHKELAAYGELLGKKQEVAKKRLQEVPAGKTGWASLKPRPPLRLS